MNRIPDKDLEHIYQNTKSIWEEFRGKSIFLTGGTGFIGKWLMESFIYINEKLELNATITSLSRNPTHFLEQFPFYKQYTKSVKFIEGDVNNFNFALSEKYHYIIHAATSASDSLIKNNPLLMLDTITFGTKNVLDFAAAQPLEGFLFLSSGAVYGKQPSDVSHLNIEDYFKIDFNKPSSSYAEGKRVGELYCSIYNQIYNLPVKIARCFAFTGPYLPLNTHFAIGNFINNVINLDNIEIKGNLNTIRSYMYASDLTVWLWTILFKGLNGDTYNVGSDIPVSMFELATKIKKVSQKKIQIHFDANQVNLEATQYVPNISKTLKLGLQNSIGIDEAITKTLSFYGV